MSCMESGIIQNSTYNKDDEELNANTEKRLLCLPYMKGLSEKAVSDLAES